MATSLYQHVIEMKLLGEQLVPWTFPRADFEVEQEVVVLKQRNIVVDGYDVHVSYSKGDYGAYALEAVQIQSSYAPFLPFVLVCKLGGAFLGSAGLSFTDFFRNNRKVYCWMVRVADGRRSPPDKDVKEADFEGFEYYLLPSGSVDFF